MVIHVRTGYWGRSTRQYFINLEELCKAYGKKDDGRLEYPLPKARKLLQQIIEDIEDCDHTADEIQYYLDTNCSKYGDEFRKLRDKYVARK